MNADPLTPLSGFAKNHHSQFGEDGIIEEILKRIAASTQTDGWCVEFGAWDGKHLSNTYHLIKNHNYQSVLIEGDQEKYNSLCKNIPQINAHKICQFVTFDGDSTLDRILQQTPIPGDFDFLSIDIDGCDYFIFESLSRYQPKIVCIEFNPTIPNDVEFIQKKDFKVKQGTSARSLVNLAESKGYQLVATTACNLLLVRKELAALVIGSDRLDLNALRDDSRFKTYIFVGYDGTILSNRAHLSLVWHRVNAGMEAFQQLPKMLRTFPSDFNRMQKILFKLLKAIRF